MGHKDPYTCKSGSEFIREYSGSPAIQSERWHGDHCTWSTTEGRVTICNSKRELPHGLRRRIAQTLIAIGIAMLIFMVATAQWPAV